MATVISWWILFKKSSISLATGIKSYWILPQVGQDTRVGTFLINPNSLSNVFATLISSTGWSLKETRIVFPIPWYNKVPIPKEDLIVPPSFVPASVTPKWRGQSKVSLASI